jgi:choline dehydrogenase-like flavoprotein
VTFRYFEEGSDAGGDDLKAVVEGIRLVRQLSAGMKPQLIAAEEMPGDGISSDDDLQQFVRDHAWGHHASCTCAIGLEARGGVLTGDFKVHRTEGLRVVDASIFPRAPGFFIASAIYMAAEKAADVIVDAARRAG